MSGGQTGSFQEDPSTERIVISKGLVDAIGGNEYGALGASVVREYRGDNTNGRILDLGDDYDLVLIARKTASLFTADHGVMVYSFRTAYGFFMNIANFPPTCPNACGSSANQWWQGKLSGADANKVKLGSAGSSSNGFNKSGIDYTIMALKLFGARS